MNIVTSAIEARLEAGEKIIVFTDKITSRQMIHDLSKSNKLNIKFETIGSPVMRLKNGGEVSFHSRAYGTPSRSRWNDGVYIDIEAMSDDQVKLIRRHFGRNGSEMIGFKL